jgi:nucleoside-diphosphate-sugar epimerase
MKNKILITGGSGFIGTNFIEFLLDKQKEGYELEILNIDIKPLKINKHYIFWKKADIKNFSELKDIFESFRPTHVLHLARKVDKNLDIFTVSNSVIS